MASNIQAVSSHKIVCLKDGDDEKKKDKKAKKECKHEKAGCCAAKAAATNEGNNTNTVAPAGNGMKCCAGKTKAACADKKAEETK